jgi:hypothetical protein
MFSSCAVFLSTKPISNINESIWVGGIISTIGHEVRFPRMAKWEKNSQAGEMEEKICKRGKVNEHLEFIPNIGY